MSYDPRIWSVIVICNIFTCVSLIFSNFSCRQIIIPLPPAVPLQRKKTQTEVCWKRLDYLKVRWSLQKRIARTAWFARMGPWTGCSCHVDTRACVMAALSIFSSAQCAGSSFENLLHFAVKKSKVKTNWKVSEDVVTTEKYTSHWRCSVLVFLELIITWNLQC